MMDDDKEQVVLSAKDLITSGLSKGTIKIAMMERFGLRANEAGRIVRTAVHQLYGSKNRDPLFWLAQDCGSSKPLQRRFARRRFRELMSGKG